MATRCRTNTRKNLGGKGVRSFPHCRRPSRSPGMHPSPHQHDTASEPGAGKRKPVDSARAPTPHSLHLRAYSHPVTIPNRGGDGRARAATSWSGEEMGQRRQESGGEGPGTRTGREGQTGNQGDSGGARRTARAGHTQAAGQGHRGRTGRADRQETADRQGTSSNKVTG